MDLLSLSSDPPTAAAAAAAAPSASSDPFALAGLQPLTPTAALVPPGGTGGEGVSSSSSSSSFAFGGVALLPLRINTQAFGAKWVGMAGGECKGRAPAAAAVRSSAEAFGAAASSAAGLHVVEIIPKTLEVILAAELPGAAGGAATSVCVHAKVMPGSGVVVITARSPSKPLAAALGEFLAKAIA